MYGLQHVLTMYGGIVAVPLIVAEAAGMSAADAGLLVTACLFMGGVATLLQTLGIPFFGCRLPLVQGVSFAGVATMVSILHTGGGMQGVLGAVMYASVLGLIIAPVFSRITKFSAAGQWLRDHGDRHVADACGCALGHGRQCQVC
jgi:xanthine/uracil permease